MPFSSKVVHESQRFASNPVFGAISRSEQLGKVGRNNSTLRVCLIIIMNIESGESKDNL